MINSYLILIVLAVMVGLSFPLPVIGSIGSFIFDPLLKSFNVFGIFITFQMLFVLSVVISLIYFTMFIAGRGN